ncbi:hypothetical protein, partial [Escherichia coli]|uniref:hypothetical protein n=1 Tax=Escherichia coli TaxID=562 RepID=UPI003079A27E
ELMKKTRQKILDQMLSKHLHQDEENEQKLQSSLVQTLWSIRWKMIDLCGRAAVSDLEGFRGHARNECGAFEIPFTAATQALEEAEGCNP